MENGSLPGRICSRRHLLYLLYATLFLLPLHPMLFYVTLVPLVLGWLVNYRWAGEVSFRRPPLWQPGAIFLIAAFLSGFVSPDTAFSLMNWAFQPLMYAALYLLVFTMSETRKEKETALYVFLAGALVTAAYGFFQYADAKDMAADMAAQSWVDPERFPLLRRRMYSTLENPNLFGAYLLMIISLLTPFFLRERGKRQAAFGILLVVFVLCLALTYSRGAWVSLAAIVLGLTLFYDKRFGILFLFIPLILFFYHGQITERFLSLFSGEDTSVGLRFALWESTEAMIEEHPLLGIGWGSYFLAYPEYNFFIQDEHVLIFHAHDMYLNMPAEVGIPGGIAFLAAFFAQGLLSCRIYRHGKDSFSKSLGLGGLLMVMAIAVISLGDHVLFSRSVSFCFWSLSALCVSDYAVTEGEKDIG
ncbi:O-antigen ligase [uncultured Dialister sp.]|uniref:O-antigen ligase family protein n=1 Tax=uncultured Dialister sp. TaxID=278064 RepID=UPI0025F36E22|nr:O-antigen ligase family protein [uncultured Dialister sp.]